MSNHIQEVRRMTRTLSRRKTKLTGQFFYRPDGKNRQDKSEQAPALMESASPDVPLCQLSGQTEMSTSPDCTTTPLIETSSM
jgi:hypothetical protein